MKLVIVESPAKAKTIEKYLSDIDAKDDFVVRASVGHVRDLPKSNKKAIDIKAGFIPHYEVVPAKRKVIQELTELANDASEVILATDPDREGEAIAWHLQEELGLKKPKRIVFHEITKEAIAEALAHPRAIDDNLRLAQEARRVLDRLVGYDLSGLIWKKVRYGLSAGRVQSPALRIIMEREREIRSFVPETFFTIEAKTRTPKGEHLLLACAIEPKERAEAERIIGKVKKDGLQVGSVEENDAKRSPRAPFTTSTLQQAASSRLGFSPSRTMQIAQKLYEAGHITYMRTDSTNLGKAAVSSILGVVSTEYGRDYAHARLFKTRSKNAQEAHEAIRPTHIEKKSLGTTPEQKKLYELIWRRTVASQMADAKLLRTRILAKTLDATVPAFTATGSRVTFDGWLKADPAARGEDIELPRVEQSDALTLESIEATEKQTTPPSRYTEAGLVKELEKRGIGRPSTYASIMKTLQDRGYVTRDGRTLIPTDTGDVVSSFLEKNFASYISDTFTAEMENELDEIAEGKREYKKTLVDFYTPFTKELKTRSSAEKITDLGPAPKEFPCPLCSAPMVYKLSRQGRFMSCSRFPDCAGARTADGTVMEGPKETGEQCPECKEGKLVERDGKFGRFISCARYPKCKYIKKSPEEEARAKTGIGCPVCKTGEMVERRGRFGPFYSCSNYPGCKNAIKARPTGNVCPLCSSLMMEGTKTIPERCSNKSCANHNPHKIQK